MSEATKPGSTWQTYNPETGVLTVYKGEDENSGVHFQGSPEDYDGTATEPASPSSEYLEKLAGEMATAPIVDDTAIPQDPTTLID